MVEVYNDPTWIVWHERFARDQKDIEAFRKQYHIPPSGERIIAVQTKILDFIPKYPAISLLLESYVRKSWARFSIPENYYNQRIFTSHFAPSLGPAEKQEADIAKLENYVREQTKRFTINLLEERKKKDQQAQEDNEEEEEEDSLIQEARAIAVMLQKGIKETNEMVDFVKARMYQFVQA